MLTDAHQIKAIFLRATRPRCPPSRICCADVSAQSRFKKPGAAQKLPAWQQSIFTDGAFYYFYLTSCQPQPWRGGSPTLNDAPTRSAAVSFSSCSAHQGSLSPHPIRIPAANHKRRLISWPVAGRYWPTLTASLSLSRLVVRYTAKTGEIGVNFGFIFLK